MFLSEVVALRIIPLHPGKLTWNLKMNPWERRFLLKTIIFRFHVSFRGGKTIKKNTPRTPSHLRILRCLACKSSQLKDVLDNSSVCYLYHDKKSGCCYLQGNFPNKFGAANRVQFLGVSRVLKRGKGSSSQTLPFLRGDYMRNPILQTAFVSWLVRGSFVIV